MTAEMADTPKLQCVTSPEGVAFSVGHCYEAFVGTDTVCVLDSQQHQHVLDASTLSSGRLSFVWVNPVNTRKKDLENN